MVLKVKIPQQQHRPTLPGYCNSQRKNKFPLKIYLYCHGKNKKRIIVCVQTHPPAPVTQNRPSLCAGLARGALIAPPGAAPTRSRARTARRAQQSPLAPANAYCCGGVGLEAARDGSERGGVAAREGRGLARGMRGECGRGVLSSCGRREGSATPWPLCSSSGVSSPVGGRNATAVVGDLENVKGEEAGTLVEVDSSSGSNSSSSSSSSSSSTGASKGKQNILKTLWEFSRPHTMVRKARLGGCRIIRRTFQISNFKG